MMTRQVKVKNVIIGGGSPISVQSMTNVRTEDTDAVLEQIANLCSAGCDIVRVAIPNKEAAESFARIRKETSAPLVADIHFDYRLAISALESGADKIRINPGNVSLKQLDAVIDCAKYNAKAIRIGVNGGSVNKEYLKTFDGDRTKALVKSLEDYTAYFEKRGFSDLVLSLKSSDVRETVRLNREAARLGYPLHVGVTEAGPMRQGIIKNSVGIGSLLLDGIGDTIRVSLTADPIEEVYAAKEILKTLGLKRGVTFVSCPKCGRCSVDLEDIAGKIYEIVANKDKDVKIAVMGCEVNGPGECSDADLGVAGANGKFVFFKNGVVYKTVEKESVLEEFIKEIDKLDK